MSGEEEVGKLFVGGVERSTTQDDFRACFAKYGELEDCVLMFDQIGMETGANRGFGFVQYKDPACAQKVLSNTPIVLNGKAVDPKPSTPRGSGRQGGGGGGGGGSGEGTINKKKLFVGGLPQSVTEEDVKSCFEPYGTVESVHLMRDRMTNNLKGYAFVHFENAESVSNLCKQRFVEMNGKQVECKPSEDRQGGFRGGRGGGGQSYGGQSYGGQSYGGQSYGGTGGGYAYAGGYGTDSYNGYGGGQGGGYQQDMYGTGGPMGGDYQRQGQSSQFHPYRR